MGLYLVRSKERKRDNFHTTVGTIAKVYNTLDDRYHTTIETKSL